MQEQELTIEYLVDAQERLPELCQWLFDEFDHIYPDETLENRTAKMKSRLNRDRSPLTIVAHIDGKTVGTSGLVPANMESHPELSPWLSTVYISPDFRGRGYGHVLIERILEEARRLGFATLYLWTYKKEKLYESMGWKLEFREQYMGVNASVMSYDLASSRQ